MAQNLLKKAVFIGAIVLICLFGIVGPTEDESKRTQYPTSWRAAVQNVQRRIHLGLDLRGGTHLVLQVMVNDAINSEADQTIERLKDDFKKRGITYAALTRIDA